MSVCCFRKATSFFSIRLKSSTLKYLSAFDLYFAFVISAGACLPPLTIASFHCDSRTLITLCSRQPERTTLSFKSNSLAKYLPTKMNECVLMSPARRAGTFVTHGAVVYWVTLCAATAE